MSARNGIKRTVLTSLRLPWGVLWEVLWGLLMERKGRVCATQSVLTGSQAA